MGLATERDELQTKNNDYKDKITKLRSENEDLQRDNAALREQMIKSSVVSDRMSGASGTSGTSGSSSNNLTRKSSKRESADKERLKDRFNRTQNDAPVVPTSATQPTPQRQRRLSKVSTTDRPYIEEPGSRPPPYNFDLVARPAPGHEQTRVPRSSYQPSGDYQFYPLPRNTSHRQ